MSEFEEMCFHAFRKEGICGTDVAAILGKSNYKTKVDVYNRLVYGYEKEDNFPSKYKDAGNRLEETILDDCVRECLPPEDCDYRIEKKLQIKHPELNWLRGNLDRTAFHENENNDLKLITNIDAKTTSIKQQGKWGSDIYAFNVPDDIKYQQIHYMYVLYKKYNVPVSLLLPVRFLEWDGLDYEIVDSRTYVISQFAFLNKYLPWYEKEVLPKLLSFWNDDVVKKNMPPEFESVQDFDESDQCLLDKLKELDLQIKQVNADKEDLKNQLKLKYTAENVVSPEGHDLLFSNRMYSRENFDSKKLRDENPEIYSKYVSSSSYQRFVIAKGI